MPFALERPSRAPIINLDRERRLRRGTLRERGRRLVVALVNNMPDGALESTRRQFTRLLEAASGEWDVRLRLYSLDSVPRETATRWEMAGVYRSARYLPGVETDALIVTGAEPRTDVLHDEVYWQDFMKLAAWSEHGVVSAIFSCLAAHAAVLARDGVSRQRLPGKLTGVFSSEVTGRHPLVNGLGPYTLAPHSRLNTLDASALEAAGYSILTRSTEAGVDLFVKDGESLQVFLQGHPEYDYETLAREFRRDSTRFARGLRPDAPRTPLHYELPAEDAPPREAPWRESSVALYRNWIDVVARRKQALQPPSFARARWGG